MASDVAHTCFQVGIDSSSLLSYASPPAAVQQLPEIQKVSNELILELLRFKDKHPQQCTFKILYSWLKDIYGKKQPDESPPTSKAVTKSV